MATTIYLYFLILQNKKGINARKELKKKKKKITTENV